MSYLDNSVQSQRERLLAWLRKRPITTIQARHNLDILAPAPRVHELRHEYGYNIQTIRVNGDNPGGGRHLSIAQYVLFPGPYKEQKHGL